MTIADRWLLPDGIEDILPDDARALEMIRRRLLDLYASWGYEYVIPPMVEFLESLLTGTGRDLDLKTLKVTDLVSGRSMGIRADMTPQVARIDAHSLNRPGPVRLCYAGTVLHSQADNMLVSRSPIKVGAELFGESGRESDLEIVSLMVSSLRVLGIENIHLELGDVSIFRALMDSAGISGPAQEELFELVQRKAFAELGDQIEHLRIPPAVGEPLEQLPSLCGHDAVIGDARKLFSGYPDILERLDNLEWLGNRLASRFNELDIYFDLSELRGYAYHTGIVFAAYLDRSGQTIAKGGRYDHIGQVFGRDRSATGFDVLLRGLSDKVPLMEDRKPRVLALPPDADSDAARWERMKQLREEGYIVVETAGPTEDIDFELVPQAGRWELQPAGDGSGETGEGE